jgi:four helix bundle protein
MAQTSPLPVSVPVSVSVSETDIPSTPRFHHERLDVYRLAIDFVVTADSIAEDLSHGRGYLADQLRRAATSIPLNIAEGAGEFSRRDKARFYRIARRSAAECAAVIDICVRLQLVADHKATHARDLLHRLISMLTRLTQR